jgi:hypothetical protein
LRRFKPLGLYLCVFDGHDEVEGVDVGAYSDFDFFRSTVTELLEEGSRGSKYPTLTLHADSDGEWSPPECEVLKRELAEISKQFGQLLPIQFRAEWQKQVSGSLGSPRLFTIPLLTLMANRSWKGCSDFAMSPFNEISPILFQ